MFVYPGEVKIYAVEVPDFFTVFLGTLALDFVDCQVFLGPGLGAVEGIGESFLEFGKIF